MGKAASVAVFALALPPECVAGSGHLVGGIVAEAAVIAARALALLERVAGSGRLVIATGCGVEIVAEAAVIAARALALLECVAHRRRLALELASLCLCVKRGVGIVAEAAVIPFRALAVQKCVAHWHRLGSSSANAAADSTAAATTALVVCKPARVAAGALALLEGVAHGRGTGTGPMVTTAVCLCALSRHFGVHPRQGVRLTLVL